MEKLTLIHATTSKSSFLLLRSHSLNTFLDSATYNRRYSVMVANRSIMLDGDKTTKTTWHKMRNNHNIYIPKESSIIVNEDNYDQVDHTSTSDPDTGSVSAESDLAESPAGQTIRSSYQSPIFGDQNPLEPCPVNGCPLNPQSGVITTYNSYF